MCPRAFHRSTGFLGIRHGGLFLQHSRDLLQRGGGGLVGVQEERHLLHRREEVADEDDRAQQRSDQDRAVRDTDAAPEHDQRERDRGDRHESRLEGSEQADRADVDVAVLEGQLAELVVVALLLAERLDGADARHRLDELHDDLRADHSRLAVHRLRAEVEPAHEQEQRDAGYRQDHAGLPVQEVERDEREHAVQHAGDQLVQPAVQQLADRVEVARLARDDPARGVRLVEFEAQALRVQEDPLPQLQHDCLRQARRDHDVPADEGGAADAGEQVHHDHADRGEPVHLLHRGGQGRVEAVRQQQGSDHAQRGRDDQHDAGQHQLPAQRRDQGSEEAQRPAADRAALVARVVRAVLARGSRHGDRAHRFTSIA